MCMHLNLKTTRVQWCLRVHEYPSAGVLCELCLCWAWTIFARPGGSSETVRECPSLLQQLVWKHGRQCGNLPASASAILILFHRGRQVWKSYQVFQGTTCDKTENQSLLYCLFLPLEAVPNLVSESQLAWTSLLPFSGFRHCIVSSNFSTKD